MPASVTFPRDLSDADALLWRIEADPVLRSPVVVVALLDREPPWPAVVAAFERAARVLPRLAQRIVPGAPGSGRLRWEDDQTFAVEHHLRRVHEREGDGFDAALAVAEADATAAFDPARPPWHAVLVDGFGDGRAVLVLRFHHAITDGVGGVDLAEAIFDRRRRQAHPEAGPPDAPVAPTATQSSPVDGVRRAAAFAGGAARAALDPLGTARTFRRTVSSVARALAPAPGPLSPILTGRSLDRRLLVTEASMATFTRAAAAVDGTVNDVFLAAVGGALRNYHARLGAPVGALRVTMPISLRAPGDPPGGNRFAPARFVLPIDDPDPAARARLAGAIVRRWREEPSLRLTDVLAALLNRLPRAAVVSVFAGMLRSIDVDAVDVPGLRHPAYLAGGKVERLWAFAPPTGAALAIALVSHGDTACIGLTCDRAAVREPELLLSCIEDGLAEIAAMGSPSVLAGVVS